MTKDESAAVYSRYCVAYADSLADRAYVERATDGTSRSTPERSAVARALGYEHARRGATLFRKEHLIELVEAYLALPEGGA